jgi:L-rhamnose mutarotase
VLEQEGHSIDRRIGLTAAAVVVSCCFAVAGCATGKAKVQRYGSVIGIEEENIAEYKRLHVAVWPEVLARLREVNIQNYSIYLTEAEPDKYYPFSYFEYTGDDFKGNTARMAADPATKRWWTHTDPLQVPVPTHKEGEWWHTIEEVFHMD